MVRQDKKKSGRITEKGSDSNSESVVSSGKSGVSRDPVKISGPSPIIVPILMFGFWGLGALLILANYLIQDRFGMPSNWYLGGGLLLVLFGFIPATQFR